MQPWSICSSITAASIGRYVIWLDTGDLGVVHEGELYITGRAKEIIVINGQNYYPYDLENIAQRAPGLELGKVVVAGYTKPGAQSEELVVFVLHRGGMAEFVSTALAVSRLVNEHTGLEVAKVVPVRKIPKTTSGKVQRHVLEQAHINGDFDADLAELCEGRSALPSMAHAGPMASASVWRGPFSPRSGVRRALYAAAAQAAIINAAQLVIDEVAGPEDA
jgi:hypothetical protein